MKFLMIPLLALTVLGFGALGASGHGTLTTSAGPVWVDSQHCDMGNEVFALVAWETANAGEQWLDISLFNNGFAPGTYLGIGPLETDRGARFLFGLVPNRTHFVRINTLTATGWVTGSMSSFLTVACGGSGPAVLAGAMHDGCEHGQLAAKFAWTPAATESQAQWLDLSTQNNGFAPGTFISAGPLESSFARYRWLGLLSYTTHYWRINTWTGSQWLTSATGSFRTGVILSAEDNACPMVV